MNKIIPGRTEVFFCGACGHLQTTELPNLDAYYATEYEINFASEDDDQLYKVIDGRPVYRAEHQANVLLRKTALRRRPPRTGLWLCESGDPAQSCDGAY
jgi:hypothetical protein